MKRGAIIPKGCGGEEEEESMVEGFWRRLLFCALAALALGAGAGGYPPNRGEHLFSGGRRQGPAGRQPAEGRARGPGGGQRNGAAAWGRPGSPGGWGRTGAAPICGGGGR